MVYSQKYDELDVNLDSLFKDSIVNKYPQFIRHLEVNTLPKLPAWSIARRIHDNLPTNNNNTNNYVESSFRFVKDIQFNRHRAFNLPDMMKLIMDSSDFYVNKCVEAANNRIATWLKASKSKYMIQRPNIDESQIHEISKDVSTVPSESKPGVVYIVDMESRCCSCYKGQLLGPCKHKWLVAQVKNVTSFDVVPTESPEMRQIYWYLGTGNVKSLDWFLPLQYERVPEGLDKSAVSDERVQYSLD